MEINISSLSLALKYVKYWCLGLNPKNNSRSDLRFSICHGKLKLKQLYQQSIKNWILIYKISTQYIRVWVDYSQSERVELAMHTSSTFHSLNWVTIHSMVFSSQSGTLGLSL